LLKSPTAADGNKLNKFDEVKLNTENSEGGQSSNRAQTSDQHIGTPKVIPTRLKSETGTPRSPKIGANSPHSQIKSSPKNSPKNSPRVSPKTVRMSPKTILRQLRIETQLSNFSAARDELSARSHEPLSEEDVMDLYPGHIILNKLGDRSHFGEIALTLNVLRYVIIII